MKQNPAPNPAHSLSYRFPTAKVWRIRVSTFSLVLAQSLCSAAGALCSSHPTPPSAQLWAHSAPLKSWLLFPGIPICSSSCGILSTVTKPSLSLHSLLPALAGNSSWSKEEACPNSKPSGSTQACETNVGSNPRFCAKSADLGLVFKGTTSMSGKAPPCLL